MLYKLYKRWLTPLFLLLLLGESAALFGEERRDIVIVVDTTESVFSFYDDINNYIVDRILSPVLVRNDYLHIISFSSEGRIEASRKISSDDDLEAVLNQLLLLQPLGQYTDLIATVDFIDNYISSLPEGDVTIVYMLTDGIHDPSPDSPNNRDIRQVKSEFSEKITRIRNRTAEFHLVLLPVNAAHNGQDDRLSGDSRTTEEGDGGLTGPESSGTQNTDTGEKTERDGTSSGEQLIDSAIGDSGTSITVFPESENIGGDEGSVTGDREASGGKEENGGQQESANGKPAGVYEDNGKAPVTVGRLGISVFIAIIVCALIVLALLFYFFLLPLLSSGKHDAAGAVSTRKAHDALKKSVFHAPPGVPVVELIVQWQKKEIGYRNIHPVPEGKSLCVGGNGSPFFIFLFPFPRCIGKLENSRGAFRFVPENGEMFPPPFNKPVENCLDKTIRAVSSTGRIVEFHFKEYISPLEQINRIMRLTQHPGPPEFTY